MVETITIRRQKGGGKFNFSIQGYRQFNPTHGYFRSTYIRGSDFSIP